MAHSLIIRRIDGLIRLFLYILIFWLPYSTAVIETCVIISLILWMTKRAILSNDQVRLAHTTKEKLFAFSKAFKPRSTILNTPIAFFLTACLLSVAGSLFLGPSLYNFFTKTLEWFIIYFLVVEVFQEKRHVYITLAIFAFTAFSTVIDSLIQFYITSKDIFNGHVIEPGSRATAGFKTPNGLGAYLTVVVPLLAAWVFLGKQKTYYRCALLAMLSLAIWSIGITFSRGAWIGLVFGGAFLIFGTLFPKSRFNMVISKGLPWVALFLCISIVIVLGSGVGQELLGRHVTIQYRMGIWHEGMEMVKDKLFFGHGINTFMKIFQAYRQNPHLGLTYAHNCFIQLAAETGLVGLFCFLWIIVRLFQQIFGKIKHIFMQSQNLGVLAIGLSSGIFAFLVHSFFDTNFYSLQLSVYLWFMVGVLISIDKIFDAPKVLEESG